MAEISRLNVAHVRNHIKYTCELSPHVTLIYGANGAGKTSLLEALYIAAQGTSFKATDREVLATSCAWYRVDAVDMNGIVRKIVYDNRGERPTKSMTIDDKKHARMPAKYRVPIVIFEPDDLRLIQGSPARRRHYLDHLLSQLDPMYSVHLRRYTRALLQRNKLLKQAVSSDTIFPWDVILSDTGAYLIAARRDVCNTLHERLTEYYRQIAGDEISLRLEYSRGADLTKQLLDQYRESFPRDQLLGSTSIGPHRDDFTIYYDEQPAERVVSRGENRTIVLSLKYIEAHLIERQFDAKPIILLDDVFGELDESRQRNLIHTFRDNQVVVTSTHRVSRLPKDTKFVAL